MGINMQLNDLVCLKSDPAKRKMRVIAVQNGYAHCIWHEENKKISGETYSIKRLINYDKKVSDLLD